MPIIGLLALVFIIMLIYSACTESRRIGTYKAFDIFGRFYAYVTIGCFLGGLVLTVILPLLQNSVNQAPSFGALLFANILPGLGLFALGVYLCIRIKRKCAAKMPDLAKHCVRDLIFCGLGMAAKMAFFFIGSVWTVIGPKEVTDANGQTLYVIGTDVYNSEGVLVGRMDGHNRFIPNANYRG